MAAGFILSRSIGLPGFHESDWELFRASCPCCLSSASSPRRLAPPRRGRLDRGQPRVGVTACSSCGHRVRWRETAAFRIRLVDREPRGASAGCPEPAGVAQPCRTFALRVGRPSAIESSRARRARGSRRTPPFGQRKADAGGAAHGAKTWGRSARRARRPEGGRAKTRGKPRRAPVGEPRYGVRSSARHFTAEQAIEVGEAIGIDWGTARFNLEQFRAGMEGESRARRPRAGHPTDRLRPGRHGQDRPGASQRVPDYYTRLARRRRRRGAQAGQAGARATRSGPGRARRRADPRRRRSHRRDRRRGNHAGAREPVVSPAAQAAVAAAGTRLGPCGR